MTHPMTIHLKNLKLAARLGVFDWERQMIREFPTQVQVKVTALDGIRQDDLQSTLDYALIEDFLRRHAAQDEWQLIERLVVSLADASLQEFPMIEEITLTLHKPGALEKTESVGVTYTQKRA